MKKITILLTAILAFQFSVAQVTPVPISMDVIMNQNLTVQVSERSSKLKKGAVGDHKGSDVYEKWANEIYLKWGDYEQDMNKMAKESNCVVLSIDNMEKTLQAIDFNALPVNTVFFIETAGWGLGEAISEKINPMIGILKTKNTKNISAFGVSDYDAFLFSDESSMNEDGTFNVKMVLNEEKLKEINSTWGKALKTVFPDKEIYVWDYMR